MVEYNFKKETQLLIVRGQDKYILDIYPDLSYSQTFNETSVKVKTLHSQSNMFDKAVITSANPANFSFTIPILKEEDLDIVNQLLLDYDDNAFEKTLKTADMYVISNTKNFKLEYAVLESGMFKIARDSILTLTVSGTARKLMDWYGSIPGNLVARSSSKTFTAPTYLEIVLDGDVLEYISAVTVEQTNSITWKDFKTLQNSLAVSSASETMFPEAFVVSGRQLSGTVQQYVTDDTDKDTTFWKVGVPLLIRVGSLSDNWGLEFSMPETVYTSRLSTDDVYTRSYDFRMTSSPSELKNVIKRSK